MYDSETPTTRTTTTRTVLLCHVATAALGLATGLAVLTAAPSSADASTPADTCVATSPTTDFASAVTRANAAMSKAVGNIRTGHYVRATRHLRVVKRQALTANTAATGLIGKPPTDPESDDLPGVAAVLSAGALDHRITMTLVPLLGDPKGKHVTAPLGTALNKADVCRDAMLGRVIALKPAARDDYVDGLSDTVPSYHQELTALTTALAGTGPTAVGRAVLLRVQGVVSATTADMDRVFGGGERSPGLPR
jgi:hypothetical protein